MVKTEKNMNSNDIFKSAEEEKKPQNRVISGKEYRTLKNENCSIRYFWTELDTWARKRNGRETFNDETNKDIPHSDATWWEFKRGRWWWTLHRQTDRRADGMILIYRPPPKKKPNADNNVVQ